MWDKVFAFCRVMRQNFQQNSVSSETESEEAAAPTLSMENVSPLTLPPMPPSETTEDEFDPIREIKRLRKDLAHRLQELQEQETVSKTEHSERDLFGASRTATNHPDSLTHHMRQAKKMLSRLQIKTMMRNRSPDLPFSVDNFETEPVPSENDVVVEPAVAPVSAVSADCSDGQGAGCHCGTPRHGCCGEKPGLSLVEKVENLEKAEKGLRNWGDPLLMINDGLTLTGLAVAVGGTAFCGFSAAMEHPGIRLIFLGVLMVGLGLFGRFYGRPGIDSSQIELPDLFRERCQEHRQVSSRPSRR